MEKVRSAEMRDKKNNEGTQKQDREIRDKKNEEVRELGYEEKPKKQ